VSLRLQIEHEFQSKAKIREEQFGKRLGTMEFPASIFLSHSIQMRYGTGNT
jgi:hypothetical protein